MGFGGSRKLDLTAEPLANPADRARTQLLVLADTLEASSRMRARIVDQVTGPDVMRCWNPRVMRHSLEVTCQQHPERDEMAFLMDGEVLAAADRPEDTAAILIERLQIRM